MKEKEQRHCKMGVVESYKEMVFASTAGELLIKFTIIESVLGFCKHKSDKIPP